MTISEKIKAIRLEKRLKQSEVADKVGVEQSYYSKLERNAGNRVFFDVLIKVCEALGITIQELLEYGEEGGKTVGNSKQELAKEKDQERLSLYRKLGAAQKQIVDTHLYYLVSFPLVAYLIKNHKLFDTLTSKQCQTYIENWIKKLPQTKEGEKIKVQYQWLPYSEYYQTIEDALKEVTPLLIDSWSSRDKLSKLLDTFPSASFN